MKKSTVLCAMLLSLTLAGCGESSKVIEGNVNNASTAEQESEAAKNETEASQESQVTYKGYVFTFGDAVVEINADATPIIEKLGESKSYFESPSCAFEGIDKLYGYTSFEVDTYPTDGKDYISAVIFNDDSISTTEGVSIGDTEDKVTETYGTDCTVENGMTVYKKDGMKLCFIIDSGTVLAIEYRTTVLDE